MNTQTEKPGIARVNGIAKEIPPTAPPVTGTTAEIQARINELEQRRLTELENLRSQQIAISERDHPVQRLLENRRLLQERIAKAEAQRAEMVAVHDEHCELIERSIGGDIHGRHFLVHTPTSMVAAYLVTKFDAWFAARKTELVKLETDVVALAELRGNVHLLPPELAK